MDGIVLHRMVSNGEDVVRWDFYKITKYKASFQSSWKNILLKCQLLFPLFSLNQESNLQKHYFYGNKTCDPRHIPFTFTAWIKHGVIMKQRLKLLLKTAITFHWSLNLMLITAITFHWSLNLMFIPEITSLEKNPFSTYSGCDLKTQWSYVYQRV